MKRIRIILTLLLATAIIVSLMGFTSAENTAEDETWQADILKLMDPDKAPASTSIHITTDLPADADVETRIYDQELVSSRGDVLNVEFRFMLNDVQMGDAQWATVTDWLKQLVLSAVQNVQADSQSLAYVIAEGYRAKRLAAQPGETGMPAWANEGLLLTDVVATVPYYPELSVDVNGSATQRLQERLIELGYLRGRADGFYGEQTKSAVMDLENYVRELEQDVIDALPTPEPSPTLEPTPLPTGDDLPIVTDVPLESMKPQPTPVTQVDGIADSMLQAYLFSGDFKISRADLRLGDEGEAVKRLQTRLLRLGYSIDEPDGVFGGGTARALRIFQHYSGLEETGIADLATQTLLFSSDAVEPAHALLAAGSSGDEVSKLQKRLRILGYASIAVDGSYGASTQTGVRNLQEYMREMEADALAVSGAQGEKAGQLTVEVNGVADPLLLDDFYSASFPEIPAEMSTGSTGRDVVRLQRRLSCLEYYTSGIDGDYGSGTVKAVSDFQRRNGLPETGAADHPTLAALFNENAKKALKPYVLKVSTDDQRVYVYAPDRDGEYTDLVKTMKCSTGRNATPTPKGTYTDTARGARWHYFTKFDCWAQYAFYIEGDIMFHSVLYNQKEGRVTQSSVNHLGSKASHGCVRLSVEDAKWIWNNCPANTKVIVY